MVGAVEGAGVASLDAELLEPVDEGFAAALASPCWADMITPFAVFSCCRRKGGGPCSKQRGLRRRVSRGSHVIEVKGHVGCSGEEEVVRALGGVGGFYSESGFVGPAFLAGAVLAWGAERAVMRESEAAKADFFRGSGGTTTNGT